VFWIAEMKRRGTLVQVRRSEASGLDMLRVGCRAKGKWKARSMACQVGEDEVHVLRTARRVRGRGQPPPPKVGTEGGVGVRRGEARV